MTLPDGIWPCNPPRMAIRAVQGGFGCELLITPASRHGARIDTVTHEPPGWRVYVGAPDQPRPASPYRPGQVLGFVEVPRGAVAITADLITVVRDGRVDCCDMHNWHCEPPGDLCCRWCTEVAHPEHPPGVACTWTAGSEVAFPQCDEEDPDCTCPTCLW